MIESLMTDIYFYGIQLSIIQISVLYAIPLIFLIITFNGLFDFYKKNSQSNENTKEKKNEEM